MTRTALHNSPELSSAVSDLANLFSGLFMVRLIYEDRTQMSLVHKNKRIQCLIFCAWSPTVFHTGSISGQMETPMEVTKARWNIVCDQWSSVPLTVVTHTALNTLSNVAGRNRCQTKPIAFLERTGSYYHNNLTTVIFVFPNWLWWLSWNRLAPKVHGDLQISTFSQAYMTFFSEIPLPFQKYAKKTSTSTKPTFFFPGEDET